MYYRKEAEEVFEDLDSNREGISSEEVSRRFEKYGPNEIAKQEKFNVIEAILNQFKDPLIYILLIAAVFTAIIQHYIDMWVILAVVLINAIIGFVQELKAEQAIQGLASITAPKAQVLREGKKIEVESSKLVPGDVVLLDAGARVPADLRLFQANRLDINESALTGESVGVSKKVEPLEDENPPLGDQHNMAFMGTLVLSGKGKGVVIKTGAQTELGKISEQVQKIKPAPTPLQVQLSKFSRYLGYGILGISAAIVLLGIALDRPLSEMLLTGIAIVVGAIPEGLPVVVTITLAIGVNKMAKRKAIIRKLPAVETLGSTNVIASDKTGTLTQNEMTVQNLLIGDTEYKATGIGFTPHGEITKDDGTPISPENNEPLRLCLQTGILANESQLGYSEEKGYYPEGDPTEVALTVAAVKAGMDPEKETESYPKLDEIPFESDRMYMATLTQNKNENDGNLVFVKGAPEKVLDMCTDVLDEKGEESSFENKEKYLEKYKSMAREGIRVLALAYKKESSDTTKLTPEKAETGLTLVGLQGMIDPPREEVYDAISQAKQGGIRVIMVTGDNHITAKAIGRKIGIIQSENEPVLTGRDVEELSDNELFHKLRHVNIFARVAPLQKLRIVKQLINRDDVVAVTGDGVNDTPALKAAHIGVAMGQGGTDAAKETSDMVVTDDNFASIFAAVKEGRIVFDNIKKVILFLLSTGLAKLILIPTSLILLMPLPLLPAQILWLNLVTNGLQDVALAFEPGEKGITQRSPRDKDEPVLSRLMIERLLIIGIVIAMGTLFTFTWALNQGYTIEHARTVALTTIVLFQLFNVFNVRSEEHSIFKINLLSNPFLFYSVIASILAQIAIIYLDAVQFIFRTSPLNVQDWLVIIPVSITVLIAVELEKLARTVIIDRRRKQFAFKKE